MDHAAISDAVLAIRGAVKEVRERYPGVSQDALVRAVIEAAAAEFLETQVGFPEELRSRFLADCDAVYVEAEQNCNESLII